MMVLVAVSALVIILFGTPTAVASPTDPADVVVLQAFRQQLQAGYVLPLRGWANRSESDPCGPSGASCGSPSSLQDVQGGSDKLCAWEGVSCRNWRVTALDVHIHSPQSANLLQTLDGLTALEQLSLSGSGLTGSLPRTPSWSSLQSLDLHGNRLTGTLPLEWGTLLRQLTYLDLRSNQLGGWLPSGWGQLNKLRRLDLSGNNLQGTIPSSWADMSSLDELLLDGNCGLCGDEPQWTNSSDAPYVYVYGSLSSVEPPRTVMVTKHGTSLGEECNFGTGVCATSDIQFPIIAASAVLSAIALCLLLRAFCCCRGQANTDASGPASGADVEAADPRPYLVEDNGRVRLVYPQKDIPSYECCVEVSVDKTVAAASTAAATVSAETSAVGGPGGLPGAGQYGGCHAAASDGTNANTSHSSSNSGVATGGLARSYGPQGYASAASIPPCSTSSTARAAQAGHIKPRLQQPCPTVILMPDQQHLALAVPDTAAEANQTLDNSARTGGSQAGSSSRPSRGGSGDRTGSVLHTRARDQHLPAPRDRLIPWLLYIRRGGQQQVQLGIV